MIDAAQALQAAAVTAIQTHPALAQSLSGVFDGPPVRAPFPYISVSGALATDWSTKTELGREIRLALNIWDDGEEPARLHNLIAQTGEAIAAMPNQLGPWRMISNIFLRSLIARDPAGPWAGLTEYRIRMLRA